MSRFRRLVPILAVVAFVGLLPATAVAKPTPLPAPAPPHLTAGAAILMDWRTGQVLYQKDAYKPRDPASTTKVLTAILALELSKLDDRVKVSRRAANTPGSRMGIRAGEVYSMHDLLHGLLLRSGNDAAVAIAEHVAGSVEAFAKLMNQRATEMGATNSQFANPHGLTQPGHYSTAHDLAVITRYALQNPRFATTVALRQQPLTYEYLKRDVILHNTNRLLHMLPGVDGVKTGTTAAAGACLVSSATRQEQKLISVVLHAGNRWNDSARLLEWGFSNYRLVYLGRKGEVVAAVPVRGGKRRTVPLALTEDAVMVLPRKMEELPKLQIDIQKNISAPVIEGNILGSAQVMHAEEMRSVIPLRAVAKVPKRTPVDAVSQTITSWLRWLLERDIF